MKPTDSRKNDSARLLRACKDLWFLLAAPSMRGILVCVCVCENCKRADEMEGGGGAAADAGAERGLCVADPEWRWWGSG